MFTKQDSFTMKEIDDLIDPQESIENAMRIIDQAEGIVSALLHLGNLNSADALETQLNEIADLLFDSQHELIQGLAFESLSEHDAKNLSDLQNTFIVSSPLHEPKDD